MSTPVDDARNAPTSLTLIIGRSDLASEWATDHITQLTIWDEAFLDGPVVTYSTPPYLNRQAAHQLMPTLTNCDLVHLHVSLLELGHHQIVDILAGLTTVLQTASATRLIDFLLEYERGNVDHYDALELAEAYQQNAYFRLLLYPNRRLRAEPLLLNEGDNGEEMEDET